MPTVNATVGDASANSYVETAEADLYFDEAIGKDAWPAAASDTRDAAVISASRYLDQYMDWNGYRTTDTQRMDFPRNGVTDRDGLLYSDTTIPELLKQAVFELAYYLVVNGGINFVDQTLDRVKVAVIDIKFTAKSIDIGIPLFIENMISHLGSSLVSGLGRAHTVRLERV